LFHDLAPEKSGGVPDHGKTLCIADDNLFYNMRLTGRSNGIGTSYDPLCVIMETREMATARLEAVEDAVRVIVRVLRPEQVYLVGSMARGEDRAGSDIDLVVVLPDDAPRQHLLLHGVYEALLDLDVPVDVVPFRRGTFERQQHSLMTLRYLALKEGRLIYDASPQAA
jgi:predicted nucleotidyltransferase